MKAMCHLSSDQERGSAEKEDSNDRMRFMQLGGTVPWQEQVIIPHLKVFGGISGVRRMPSDCVSVSGGLAGDMHKHMLAKIIGGGKEKQKYPTRKCIT
jgi:hypothetical protein